MDARPNWIPWAALIWAWMLTSVAQAEGLPAFRDIVRDNRASVVHISVEGRARNAPAAMHQDPRFRGSPFERFFRDYGAPQGQAPAPQRGMGSGFIISKDGQVMTNAHVVKDAARILVRLSDRREVEATLVQHTAILEAAVIGVPDANGLTRVKAYVVLKDGATATSEELQAFVKERLAPYKYPRQIEFLDELPKTATGKIQRFRLRAANA